MTSLQSSVYNVGLLILLILFVLWLLHALQRAASLYLLSSAYSRHELLQVEGLTRHSNLTREHLLSILRARSSHTPFPTDRYHIAAHVHTAVGKVARLSKPDPSSPSHHTDPAPSHPSPTSPPPLTPSPLSDDIGLYLRVSCSRPSRMDVFIGVAHSTIAHLHTARGDVAGGKDKRKGRLKFHTPHKAELPPAIDINKANALRLPSHPFLNSPSPQRSALLSSPSPNARSLTPRTDTTDTTHSTLAGLEMVAFPQRRGITGFPASNSSSFLPLFADKLEEKEQAAADAATREDSDDTPTPPTDPLTSTPLGLHTRLPHPSSPPPPIQPPEPALLCGLSLTDLQVLLRNKSPADDDVHALHEDDYAHRVAPMVMEPCVDRDVMVTLPREWMLTLHQRMEAKVGGGGGGGGRGGGEGGDWYPIVVQLRPIDEQGLPAAPCSYHKEGVEEKEKASDLFDSTKPSPLTTTPGKEELEEVAQLADDPTKRLLVAELSMMEYARHIRADADAGSPVASPRSLFSSSVSRQFSPTPSARSLSPTPGGGSPHLPSPALFDAYLSHLRFSHQLLITPSHAVYHVEELFGMEAEHRDCIVCLTEPKDIILLPCRHVCVCHTCHRSVTKCPVCRSAILNYAKWEGEGGPGGAEGKEKEGGGGGGRWGGGGGGEGEASGVD